MCRLPAVLPSTPIAPLLLTLLMHAVRGSSSFMPVRCNTHQTDDRQRTLDTLSGC
jgi:hypothetical protein